MSPGTALGFFWALGGRKDGLRKDFDIIVLQLQQKYASFIAFQLILAGLRYA